MKYLGLATIPRVQPSFPTGNRQAIEGQITDLKAWALKEYSVLRSPPRGDEQILRQSG